MGLVRQKTVCDFDIVVGSPKEVADQVRAKVKAGWSLLGETKYLFNQHGNAPLLAAQSIAILEDEPEPPPYRPPYGNRTPQTPRPGPPRGSAGEAFPTRGGR